jgi:hypothetical protein
MIRRRHTQPAVVAWRLVGCILGVALLMSSCSGDTASPRTTEPVTAVTSTSGGVTSASVIPEPLEGTVLIVRGADDPITMDRVVRTGDGGEVASGQTFTVPTATEVGSIAMEVVAEGETSGRAASVELYRFDELDAAEPSERVDSTDDPLWRGSLPVLPEGEPRWLSFGVRAGTVLEPGVRYGVLLTLGGRGEGVLWLQHRTDDDEPTLQLDGSRWRSPEGASTLLVDGTPA